MSQTDLSSFDNSDYKPGGLVQRVLWYVVSPMVFKNSLFVFMRPKRFLLRLFGAKIGRGLIIKPCVNIKYPWRLVVGDHCWIGEQVWIDNLNQVVIGDHVCLSQGAMLLCGNHDYKKPSFDLITGPIHIDDGAWIGAKTMVCPGVKVGSHAILAVTSTATSDLDAWAIYQGNPAVKIRDRKFNAE